MERSAGDLKAGPDEERCYELLRRARWPAGITCPLCGGRRVTNHTTGRRTPRRRYLCLGCRRTFTDFTGTPLAQTNLPLAKWFDCLRLLGERHTTIELARSLEVKWETAARLERRLVVALARPGFLRQLREALEKADRE